MNNEAATSHPDACDKYLSTTIPAWCERHSRILFGLIVLIVLAGFNNQWLIGPDSALHLNIGRNLAAGLGYMHPDGLHKGLNPGLAYMTALGFSLFGPDHLLTSHVINVGLGGIGLALTYWLFRLHCDRGTAILITALLGTNENYYHYLYILLADLPFAVGVLLSLVGYERIQKKSREGGDAKTISLRPFDFALRARSGHALRLGARHPVTVSHPRAARLVRIGPRCRGNLQNEANLFFNISA
ncbi:MAG: hypothetical protein IID61_06825 [SAR324 cluster bacterium]|nr:hypothetical protein [SAR324 cluster bacterium]